MIFRINKTSNYTVMSNYHLRDKNLSLKAKGLLSWMLSNNDDWDYSIAGIVACCKEGETTVNTALRELQEYGYVKIVKCKPDKDNNRIHYEYNVYENPQDVECQDIESLVLESQALENQVQRNTKASNTKESKKEVVSKDTTTEFTFGNKKPKKQNLYTKCVSLIDQKTNDTEIRSLLIDWLNMLLEKYRLRNKVLYANVFKGKLNMLDKFDNKDWKEIIEYNLQKGYEGFYPIPSYNYRTDLKDKPWEKGVKSEAYTEEEKRQIEREREEMEARGERVWY